MNSRRALAIAVVFATIATVLAPLAAGQATRRDWWRFSSRLRTSDGRSFGYVATFFRYTIGSPPEDVLTAVMSLSDLASAKRVIAERSGREALGDAMVSSDEGLLSLSSWRVDRQRGSDVVRIVTAGGDFSVALSLAGWSREPIRNIRGWFARHANENGTMYSARTRLATSGTIVFDHHAYRVVGTSWVDHVRGGSELSSHPAWDLYEMQLSDGHDVVVSLIRDDDGLQRQRGIVVARDGTVRALGTVAISRHRGAGPYFWRSPRTETRYPNIYHLTVGALGIDCVASPTIADQEIAPVGAGAPYWDGALDVANFASDPPLSGIGFAELTGH